MPAAVTSRGGPGSLKVLLRDLAAAGFDIGEPAGVTTTVLDTFDGRLHDDRLRLDVDGPTLVLHGPGSARASATVAASPRVAEDLPAGPLRDRLLAVTEVRALLPMTTVGSTIRRAECRNADGKVVVEILVHDRIDAGGVAINEWLVEVDELTGYGHPAADARDIVARHASSPVDGDAVGTALAIAGVELGGRHVKPGIPLDAEQPAVEGFRLVLANLAEAIATNVPGTVDDTDPEFLHDLRVAVRRSRSIVRHGRNVLPPAVVAWAEPALRSLGTLTSPPRDLDVHVMEWDEHAAPLGAEVVKALAPVRTKLVADRKAAHEALAVQLRSADVRALLERWTATVAAPMPTGEAGPRGAERLVDVVRWRIEKAYRRMIEHGRAVTRDSPGEVVHEVRKDGKQVRYLLECFAGVLPADGRKAFVHRLKHLQDVLGDHQDAVVLADSLRCVADQLPPTTSPETYLGIGQLVEQLEAGGRSARNDFAGRFAEFDSGPTRRALQAMLAGAGS